VQGDPAGGQEFDLPLVLKVLVPLFERYPEALRVIPLTSAELARQQSLHVSTCCLSLLKSVTYAQSPVRDHSTEESAKKTDDRPPCGPLQEGESTEQTG
jgi:hypothetical protein